MAVTDDREVAARYHALERMAGKHGCQVNHTLHDFMTMTFLTLPVIPALKITN